jgi:hypothetical protein
MRTITIICSAIVLSTAGSLVQAESGAQKTLAATLGIQVFPAAGQAADQQSKDEAACYEWAVSNTGTDPFDTQKQQTADAEQAAAAQQQAGQAGKGSGLQGAARGAAVGAIIGEVTDDDASKGAGYGAAAGAIAGRRRGHAETQQAQQQTEAQSQATQHATQAQLETFKNAFSACMEGKKYIAKF